VASFFAQWLDFEKISKIGKADKSAVAFPTFTARLPALLRQEADLFAQDVFFSGGDLSRLLTGNYTFMNQQLAGFYGVTGPSSATFEKVTLNPHQRAGVLTQAGFLASHAKADQTSPVQRGSRRASSISSRTTTLALRRSSARAIARSSTRT
jgi:hypothetical protein